MIQEATSFPVLFFFGNEVYPEVSIFETRPFDLETKRAKMSSEISLFVFIRALAIGSFCGLH